MLNSETGEKDRLHQTLEFKTKCGDYFQRNKCHFHFNLKGSVSATQLALFMQHSASTIIATSGKLLLFHTGHIIPGELSFTSESL